MEQHIEKKEEVLKEATFESDFEGNLDSTFTKLEKIQKKIVREKISYLEKYLEELEVFFTKMIDNAEHLS